MPGWITENIGTIVIALALAAIVVFIVRSLVKDKKQGKHAFFHQNSLLNHIKRGSRNPAAASVFTQTRR